MKTFAWGEAAGYARAELSGLRMEKTLDEIAKECDVKNIRRLSYTTVVLDVGCASIKRMKRIAAEGNIDVKIIKKDRKLTFITKAVRRWWVPVTLAAAAAGVFVLSGFCMSISVDGLKSLSEFAVVSVIKENGADIFVRKSKIDLDKIEKALYSSFKEIAYANLKFDGVRLSVTVGEGSVPPKIVPGEPCSVEADKGGVVEKITVRFGEARVKEGDIVKEGDVLIAGAYTKNEVDFAIHASGEVWALVDYTGGAEAEYDKDRLFRTGKTASQRFLTLGGLRIPLSGENPFELYEEERETGAVAVNNSLGFLKTENVVYYECETGTNDEGKSRARLEAAEKAYYEALKKTPADAVITDFNSYVVYEGGRAKAIGIVTVRENIGRDAPVLYESEDTEDTGGIGEQAGSN